MTRIASLPLSSIVDALTPRMRKRVDAYLADGMEVGVQTFFGQSMVRIAKVDALCDEDEIVCDCLLAPRCAHRAVVALSLELADGTETEEGTGAEEERRAVLDIPAESAAQSGDTAVESGVGAANENGVGAWAESGPNAGVKRGVGAAPESNGALRGSNPGESASPSASATKTPGTNGAKTPTRGCTKTSDASPAQAPGMEGPTIPGAKTSGTSDTGSTKTPRAGSAKTLSTRPA